MEDVRVLHSFGGDHNKLYVVRLDRIGHGEFRVVASYGSARDTYLKDHIKGTRHTLDQAQRLAETVARGKQRGGYRDTDEGTYQRDCPRDRRLTVNQVLTKIDTTRLAHKWSARPHPVPSSMPVMDEAEHEGPARRERNLFV